MIQQSTVIGNVNPSGCGLPIGNLTSQLFSNIYLSGLDDFVKRELRFRHYGRYIDDFYIVSTSREDLLAEIPLIRVFLSRELGLCLHPRKSHLTDVRKGVRFLGAVIKPYQRYVYHRGLSRAREHQYSLAQMYSCRQTPHSSLEVFLAVEYVLHPGSVSIVYICQYGPLILGSCRALGRQGHFQLYFNNIPYSVNSK